MLRYVKSSEELEQLQGIYAAPAFLGIRSLSIPFETDPEVVRAVLPPPLEPADQPIVSVGVSEITGSNCVGPFYGSSINIQARYKDLVGNYCLTMPMSTDIAVIFGRELYGEPKKLARIALKRDGQKLVGTVERHGITYIELQGEMTEQVEVGEEESKQESNHFYYKYMPSADGQGLDHDPLLVHVHHRGSFGHVERGKGQILFRESPHDPVIDLPIVNSADASYVEGETFTTARTLCSVDCDAFMPYAFGKIDAMDALACEGKLPARAPAS